MQKVRVIAFGKIKTSGLRETADHYKKLLKSFCDLEEIELKPEKVPEKNSALLEKIRKKEKDLLSKYLLSNRQVYILDEKGKNLKTTEWAQLLTTVEKDSSLKGVDFLIGSSIGFDPEIKEHSRWKKISFGAQTLPHELARILLFEQLYRAKSYLAGHPYHNETD